DYYCMIWHNSSYWVF
nr:immunoglobulin light chain junction region [Macaca mulatta]